MKENPKKVEDSLPTEMTIGGRTYEILSFLQENETSTHGHIMVDCAIKMNANLGLDDGEHILRHQDEIPVSLRDISFIFPDWHDPDPGYACCLWWDKDENQWVQRSLLIDNDFWFDCDYLLRRK